MPACASFPAAIWRGRKATASIPAKAISGWRWCPTVNRRPRHCTGWGKIWLYREALGAMPAIERGIPLVGHLPTSIRDALVRRVRELIGFGLITLAGVV